MFSGVSQFGGAFLGGGVLLIRVMSFASLDLGPEIFLNIPCTVDIVRRCTYTHFLANPHQSAGLLQLHCPAGIMVT